MAKPDEEKAAIEVLKSLGLDPEAMAKEKAESKDRIERLKDRIQVTRGRVRERRNFTIYRQD